MDPWAIVATIAGVIGAVAAVVQVLQYRRDRRKKSKAGGKTAAPPVMTREAGRPKLYHNLPQPDYVRFVGREQERQMVQNLLAPTGRAWVIVIDGIGGVGKSALALDVAHHYLQEYDRLPEAERFQAVIWTSAKATALTADGPVPRQQVIRTLEDIYATISVTLEREDITRSRPEEQDDLICQALIQQRTLLVVDNLETIDDERVNAFLRELPAPTKCLVTSRHRLDVAYAVRLQGMPEEDGLSLIAHECAKKDVLLEKDQAERLHRRTGGIPLAIVWSVAQMGYGYGIDAVLQRLGSAQGDIARYCFQGAVDRLRRTPAYRLLLALALFHNDAGREALGYVAELPELDRDEGLVDLEKLSLVNRADGQFQMLPLTNGYARAELSGFTYRDQIQDRWLRYYQEASTRYGDEHWNWRNFEWLLLEGENCLAVADWAIANGREDAALAIARPTMRYLDIRGRWSKLAQYGELLRTIAERLNDHRTRAWILVHWLAWLYAEQGEPERAGRLAQEAHALYHALGDDKGICLAMLYESRSARRQEQYADSKRITLEMKAFAQGIGYGDGVALADDQLGKIARDQELWAEAKEYLEAALCWCEGEAANLDATVLMNILGNLGWVEFHLGNYERGKEWCERSLRSFERIGGRGYTTTLQCHLASIELALGNNERALQYAQEALYWADRLRMIRDGERARAVLKQLEQGPATGQGRN